MVQPVDELLLWVYNCFQIYVCFTGTIELNLSNMPMPAKRAGQCSLKQLPDITLGNTNVKTVSLFEQKRLRGFWPVYDERDGQRLLTVS